jgi:integrase
MSLFRRKPDGPWYYLFYVAGKPYKKSTKTRNEVEAERIEKRAYVAAEKGESVTPQKAPILRDFIHQFKKWVALINRSDKTRADYLNGCRLILDTPLAGMRVDRITADDVMATKFHDSPYSTNCALRTLRRALHRGLNSKELREIPKIKLVPAPRRERIVTPANETLLLTGIRRAADSRRYKKRPPSPLEDVFTIILDSGMRPREIATMRIEWIDWSGSYFTRKGKTKKARRNAPLSERVLELLKKRCGSRKEGWVFPSPKAASGHIELRGFQKHFRKIADDLGLPGDLKIYCGRHTFGTVTMEKTKNPYVVMNGMGHEDLETTMEYCHNDTAQLKTVIDEWNRQKAEMATNPLTDSVQ